MDETVAFWVRDHLPPLHFFSYLGAGDVLLMLIIVMTLFFILTGRFQQAHILLLTTIISFVLSHSLKLIIGRPRPHLWPPAEVLHSYSFPSGHALSVTAIYGILAFLLASHYKNYKRLIYGFFAVIAIGVGVSRVQMGVHWPTDVIGGWAIGALILGLMAWWYKNGGIVRTVRIAVGVAAILLGLIGLILPFIPGIPLLIGGFLLIFSNKKILDYFKRSKKGHHAGS